MSLRLRILLLQVVGAVVAGAMGIVALVVLVINLLTGRRTV